MLLPVRGARSFALPPKPELSTSREPLTRFKTIRRFHPAHRVAPAFRRALQSNLPRPARQPPPAPSFSGFPRPSVSGKSINLNHLGRRVKGRNRLFPRAGTASARFPGKPSRIAPHRPLVNPRRDTALFRRAPVRGSNYTFPSTPRQGARVQSDSCAGWCAASRTRRRRPRRRNRGGRRVMDRSEGERSRE